MNINFKNEFGHLQEYLGENPFSALSEIPIRIPKPWWVLVDNRRSGTLTAPQTLQELSIKLAVEQEQKNQEAYERMQHFLVSPYNSKIIYEIMLHRCQISSSKDLPSVVADIRNTDSWRGQKYGQYMDGTHAFVLAQQGLPLAVVSFEQTPEALEVKQIQGSKGCGETLAVLGRWEAKLVRVVEQYAQFARIPEVAILPAEENIWVFRPHGNRLDSPILSLAKAKRRYDRTARNLGYNYDLSRKRFIKSAGTESSY